MGSNTLKWINLNRNPKLHVSRKRLPFAVYFFTRLGRRSTHDSRWAFTGLPWGFFHTKHKYFSDTSSRSRSLKTATAHDNAHTLFQFTAYEPVRCMRPVIEGILTQSFPTDTSCYVAFDWSATYTSSQKQKELTTTTYNDHQTYPSSELRFSQTQQLSRDLLESKPNGSINWRLWPSSHDPLTLPCFRTTDKHNRSISELLNNRGNGKIDCFFVVIEMKKNF